VVLQSPRIRHARHKVMRQRSGEYHGFSTYVLSQNIYTRIRTLSSSNVPRSGYVFWIPANFEYWKCRSSLNNLVQHISPNILRNSIYAVPRRILELPAAGPATVFVKEPPSIYTPLKKKSSVLSLWPETGSSRTPRCQSSPLEEADALTAGTVKVKGSEPVECQKATEVPKFCFKST
jgi:hypothetical protein